MPDTIITRIRDAYMRNPAETLGMLPELSETEGRIVELPCAIGTPVCLIKSNQHDGFWMEPAFLDLGMMPSIGKTVFLTRAEAEQAMKKPPRFEAVDRLIFQVSLILRWKRW